MRINHLYRDDLDGLEISSSAQQVGTGLCHLESSCSNRYPALDSYLQMVDALLHAHTLCGERECCLCVCGSRSTDYVKSVLVSKYRSTSRMDALETRKAPHLSRLRVLAASGTGF